MADIFITLNGNKYISTKYLIDAMVKVCVEGTEIDDLEIYDGERTLVVAFQDLLNKVQSLELRKDFHDKYVNERFVKRTMGV